MKNDQTGVFESDRLWASIFKMVIPTLIAILVMLVYNMADMIFVGQTGVTAQVAAISVVGPVFSMIMAVALLISGGGSVLISKDLGANDTEHAKTVSSLCMWTAIILGILSGAGIILFRDSLLGVLGATPDIMDHARKYMVILALGAPFMMVSNMLAQVLRAEGAVKDALMGNLAGTVVNIVLDPIFILTLDMGVSGAAIATVLGNIVSTAFYGRYMMKKAVVLNMNPSYALKKPLYIITIMSVGLPNAISTLLSGVSGSLVNQLLSKYGSDPIAANAAAGRVNMIIVMILMGICMGAQPLIAYNYGAGNTRKLAAIMKRLVLLTAGVGLLTTIGVVSAKHTIIGLFLKEAEVAGMAEHILTIIMVSSPFIGAFFLGTNFLQATDNAMKATVISVLQKGLLLTPALFILDHLYGLSGIWWANMVADFAAVLIAVSFMISGWMKISKIDKRNPEALSAA